MKRVVITGLGITSPLGSTVSDSYKRLQTYQNCIKHWEKLDEYERLNTTLGAFVEGLEIPEHFDRKTRRTMGQVALMATITAEQALKDEINNRPESVDISNVGGAISGSTSSDASSTISSIL